MHKRITHIFLLSEVTSIRSGLRKRKRAESPQPSEPQISEEWVEEDKLELWEIKLIGEKIERAKLTTTTRSITQQRLNDASTSNVNSTPISSSKCISNSKILNDDVKEKPDQPMRMQRNTSSIQKKYVDTNKTTPQGKENSRKSKNHLIFHVVLLAKGQIIASRRVIVKNPDGTTRIIQQTVAPQVSKQSASSGNSAADTSATTSTASNFKQHLQSTSQTPSKSANNLATSASPAPQQHKVQIIRGPDGKVSVRGLNPGQQLIQMPDGKLHVLTTAPSSSTSTGAIANQSKHNTHDLKLLFIYFVRVKFLLQFL